MCIVFIVGSYVDTTLTEYETRESEVLKLLNTVSVAKREVEIVSRFVIMYSSLCTPKYCSVSVKLTLVNGAK